MTIQVFFPHARSPIGKPLELKVRKDATIEEVIGFALWSYWEEDWQPKLDEGLDGVDEARKKAHLSAAGWPFENCRRRWRGRRRFSRSVYLGFECHESLT